MVFTRTTILLLLPLLILACGGGKSSVSPVQDDTVPLNNPPVAIISTERLSDIEGGLIVINATASTDPEGSELTYLWKIIYQEKELGTRIEKQTFFSLPEVETGGGSVELQLTVTDNKGKSDTATLLINVDNIEINSATLSLQEKCSWLDLDQPHAYEQSGSRVGATTYLTCLLKTASTLSQAELEEIKKFSNLSSLDFKSDNGLINIDSFPDLSSLEALGAIHLDNVDILESLSPIKNLNSLHVSGIKLTPTIYNFSNLHSLGLSNSLLNDAIDLTKLDQLEELSLHKMTIVASLQLPDSLERLNISDSSIDISTNTILQNQKKLKFLYFFNTKLPNSEVVKVFGTTQLSHFFHFC